MYQIVKEIRVDGKREADSIYPKIYVRKGPAERYARGRYGAYRTDDGKIVEWKSYVRGFLRPVTEDEAKTAYCKGRRIWVDDEYGQTRIRASWEYGSHAPDEELFYRGVCHCRGYYRKYDGNYYIEDEK